MPKNLRFWTNVTLIALVHVVLIVGLIRLSRENKSAGAQSVVWLDGGAGDGMVTQKKNLPAPVKSPFQPWFPPCAFASSGYRCSSSAALQATCSCLSRRPSSSR